MRPASSTQSRGSASSQGTEQSLFRAAIRPHAPAGSTWAAKLATSPAGASVGSGRSEEADGATRAPSSSTGWSCEGTFSTTAPPCLFKSSCCFQSSFKPFLPFIKTTSIHTSPCCSKFARHSAGLQHLTRGSGETTRSALITLLNSFSDHTVLDRGNCGLEPQHREKKEHTAMHC
jgi:hypothetical protein